MKRAPLLTAAIVAAATLAAQSPAPERSLPRGIDAGIQKSIDRGLAWLSRNQVSDGSWRNAGGYGTYPVAMTALAGMAFLASGSTPTRGRHWREVRAASDYLIGRFDAPTGYISLGREEHHGMYGHGFATLFLASVHGMEEDVEKQRRFARVLDGAVALISAAQSSAGGWYYTPDSNNDEGSVTVTQIQALRACRMAGIVVDKKTIDKAIDYVRRCQNEDGGIVYKLSMAGSQSQPAISAAGVAVLYNAGVYDDQPFVDAAVRYCKRVLDVEVDNTGHHYYAHYYWAQALYHRGGDDWDAYYRRAAKWLQARQRADGSWQGDGVGAVYGTAIALTILQLPYAFVHHR